MEQFAWSQAMGSQQRMEIVLPQTVMLLLIMLLVSVKEGDTHQASSEAIATSCSHPIPSQTVLLHDHREEH